MSEPKVTDPILEEIYRFRDEHAKKFNYDIDAIAEDIRQRTKNSGRTFVTLDGSDKKSAQHANSDSPKTTSN